MVTIHRGCFISWLLTHFFFKSQNISFLNSCCPSPVLCSSEGLRWGCTFENVTALWRAGREGFVQLDDENRGAL